MKDPDLIWEALVAACGYPAGAVFTKTERGRLNAAVKELKEILATPHDIASRAREYRRRWPGIELTPQALVGNWNRMIPETPRYSQGQNTHVSQEREVLTPEQRAENKRRFAEMTRSLRMGEL